MENSVLKNKIAPNQHKGRWYKAFIESDGTDYTLTTCELADAEISSGVLVMPEDMHITDVKYEINVDTAAAYTYSPEFKGYASGKQGVVLPDEAQFDWMYLWVYAYRLS